MRTGSRLSIGQATATNICICLDSGRASATFSLLESVWMEMCAFYEELIDSGWWESDKSGGARGEMSVGEYPKWTMNCCREAVDALYPNGNRKDEVVHLERHSKDGPESVGLWIPRSDFDQMVRWWNKHGRTGSDLETASRLAAALWDTEGQAKVFLDPKEGLIVVRPEDLDGKGNIMEYKILRIDPCPPLPNRS